MAFPSRASAMSSSVSTLAASFPSHTGPDVVRPRTAPQRPFRFDGAHTASGHMAKGSTMAAITLLIFACGLGVMFGAGFTP